MIQFDKGTRMSSRSTEGELIHERKTIIWIFQTRNEKRSFNSKRYINGSNEMEKISVFLCN